MSYLILLYDPELTHQKPCQDVPTVKIRVSVGRGGQRTGVPEGGHMGMCLLYIVFHIEKKKQGLMMKKKKKEKVSLLSNNHE